MATSQYVHTHCHILLKVFLAADEMRDLGTDVVGDDASVDGDPVPDPVRGALLAEVAGDGDGAAFEGLCPCRGAG